MAELMETVSQDDIKSLIKEGLDQLRLQDGDMLKNGTQERAVVATLKEYLLNLLPQKLPSCKHMRIDTEYNRHGDDIKKCDADNIIPDLTIHKRGTDDQNLAVMEFKRYGNKAYRKAGDADDDDRKLKRLTETLGDYGYKYGFFIEIPVGERAIESPFKITLYKDGKPIETYGI